MVVVNELTHFRKYRDDHPFIGIFSMRSPQIFLLAPEIIKDVLIKNFKNFHDNEFGDMVNAILTFSFGISTNNYLFYHRLIKIRIHYLVEIHSYYRVKNGKTSGQK